MLTLDKLFITSRFEGLIYSLKNKVPTILYGEYKNLKHKFLLEPFNAPFFVELQGRDLVVDGEHVSTLGSIEEAQNQVIINMGLKGLTPFSEPLKELYVLDDILLLTFDNIGSFDVSFKELIVTEEVKIIGADLKSTEISSSLIIDYFKSEKLRSLKDDILFPKDNILKQIYFWKEKNIVISISEAVDTSDFDASWIPLKYKIIKNMFEASGQKLRLWPIRREVEERVKYIYEEEPSITIFDDIKCLKHLGI